MLNPIMHMFRKIIKKEIYELLQTHALQRLSGILYSIKVSSVILHRL